MELDITPEPIDSYCVNHSSKLPDVFKSLSETTNREFPQVAQMQVGALEGNFLSMLVRLMKAERVLEFGTFTGFSSLCFALSLPANGTVTTLDRDPKATSFAKQFWKQAGVDQKVELILGDGRETIKKLTEEVKNGERPSYDFAFIDADKSGYETYYEACLKLVRKGGAILADNVLWSGAVLDPKENSDIAICAFNEKLKNDSRVDLVMLPIRDGITVAIVK